MKKHPILLFLVFMLVITLSIPIVGASPDIEDVWVNAFDDTLTEWTTTGGSPYLTDSDANYIGAISKDVQEGYFDFVDTTQSGTINSVYIYFECYADDAPTNDGFDVYIWDDGASDWVSAGWVRPSVTVWGTYENLDISAILTTWGEVDAARLYVEYHETGAKDDVFIRRCYIRVDWSAVGEEYSRSVSQSLSFSLGVTKLFEVTRGVDQSVGISLDGLRLIDVTRTATQGIGIGLSTSKILNFVRDATQTIGLSLATTRAGGVFRSVSQTINIASNSGRLAELARVASQTISIAIQSARAVAGNFVGDVSLTISLALESSRLSDLHRSVTQAISVLVSADGFKGFVRAASLLMNISTDGALGLIEVSRSVSQYITVDLQTMRSGSESFLGNVSLAVRLALEGTWPGNPGNPGSSLFDRVFAGIPTRMNEIIVPLFAVVAILVALKMADQIFDTGDIPDVMTVLGELSGPTWVLIAVAVMLLILLAGINI